MGTIVVQNLGKAYKNYANQWGRLVEWLSPRNRINHTLTWVMQDVSFLIKPGESVGIIGMNGAGKSTLLKMITGTIQPTTGSVKMSGKVAALLELGMGFHPEFTGRQNALMAGQLLGYSAQEIINLMPEIESFAEIGGYMDQPLRVYSSGMQVRLAFSVATAIRPDILIVDEALSVGDAYFQHKSLDRIRQFRELGTTLLLVSHDKQTVLTVCDRAILLDSGKVSFEGNPEAAMNFYNAKLAENKRAEIRSEFSKEGKSGVVSGTGEAKVEDVCLLDEKGVRLETVEVGQLVVLRIDIRTFSNIKRLTLGYGIRDRLGQVLYGTNTNHTNQHLEFVKENTPIRFDIRFRANLGPGTYSIQTALHSTDTHLIDNFEWRNFALVFTVINLNQIPFEGMAWLPSKFEIQYI